MTHVFLGRIPSVNGMSKHIYVINLDLAYIMILDMHFLIELNFKRLGTAVIELHFEG